MDGVRERERERQRDRNDNEQKNEDAWKKVFFEESSLSMQKLRHMYEHLSIFMLNKCECFEWQTQPASVSMFLNMNIPEIKKKSTKNRLQKLAVWTDLNCVYFCVVLMKREIHSSKIKSMHHKVTYGFSKIHRKQWITNGLKMTILIYFFQQLDNLYGTLH